MTQKELDAAVATATGEDVSNIRSMGFSIADLLEVNFDPEPYYPPQVVDWDQLALERNVAVFPQRLCPIFEAV